MDDLEGLDWSTPVVNTDRGSAGTTTFNTILRPNSASQNFEKNMLMPIQPPNLRNSFARPTTVLNSDAKVKPADSFSYLVSFGSLKESPTLTLKQQQQKLECERKRLELEKKKQYDLQFGNGSCWDEIGKKSSEEATTLHLTPHTNTCAPQSSSRSRERPISSPAANGDAVTGSGADFDLFAAFNAETEVDVSSHYPPPQKSYLVTKKHLDLTKPKDWELLESSSSTNFHNDDDPFGLNQVKSDFPVPSLTTTNINDEDFLGDLGRPLEELEREKMPRQEMESEHNLKLKENDMLHKAIAELVKMGFTAEKSQLALTETGPGLDMQAAVSWLLNHTHCQPQKRDPSKNPGGGSKAIEFSNSDQYPKKNLASQINVEQSLSRKPRYSAGSSNGDVDLSKAVSTVSNNLVKSANSFWKSSQKKVQKVVSDIQQQGLASQPPQPKWMREAAHPGHTGGTSSMDGRASDDKSSDITDEALMLEKRDRSVPNKMRVTQSRACKPDSTFNQSSTSTKALPISHDSNGSWKKSVPEVKRINSQTNDILHEQAYISPARRKKISPHTTTHEKNSDKSLKKTSSSHDSSFASRQPPCIPPIAKPSLRHLPDLSPTDLGSSTLHRLAGTSHFKRGDYVSAHSSYSSSISALPKSHPINIVLFCNRALTSLKNGAPKSAVLDADRALDLIGESRGDGEIINLGPGESGGDRDMKTFYAKAMMRKAEALEQMESWKDAAEIWKTCVEQGLGGSLAVEGRTRCEKMLLPRPLLNRVQKSISQNKISPGSSILNSNSPSGEDSAAVKRLREANEKAEIADNEKLSLIDKVDARVAHWRDGKKDNLRALIASLDGIMWKESEWKKVGMHELVQNNKVKINYMKAIGKTHPDKLPQDASMEVRMIAALVFATLNESWDKFKQQNEM